MRKNGAMRKKEMKSAFQKKIEKNSITPCRRSEACETKQIALHLLTCIQAPPLDPHLI